MKPNVLFFVIDALRADKCHGSQKTSLTPNIDSLIENGAYFSQAISSVAATLPSLASICSGLFAFKTGISGNKTENLPWDAQSIFDIFKKNGYNVYATLPEFSSDFGLTGKFEKKFSSDHNFASIFDKLGNKIINLFNSNEMKEPWIQFIHILDLHYEVWLKKEFDEPKFGINKYERMLSAIDVWLGKILDKISTENTLVVITSDHGEYLPIITSENTRISFEEGVIDKLLWKIGSHMPSSLNTYKNKFYYAFQKKRKQMKLSKTKQELSSHEKRAFFGTRGKLDSDHHLYDELLRVPLIFAGFGIPQGMNISQQVRHVDVFPTIAKIINLPLDDNDIDGMSLTPLLKGEKFDEKPAYIESPYSYKESTGHVIGIRTSKYKYFRKLNQTKKESELYDLEDDPFEENNIASKNLAVVEKMEKILVNIRKKTKKVNEINSEDKRRKEALLEEKLKKLGYM